MTSDPPRPTSGRVFKSLLACRSPPTRRLLGRRILLISLTTQQNQTERSPVLQESSEEPEPVDLGNVVVLSDGS